MNEDLVIVGSIGSPYGLKGWVKINSSTAPITNILDFSHWFISFDTDKWQEVELAEGREHGSGVVARISSCEDRDEAAVLTGSKIAVKRESFAQLEDGEYYWADLQDCMVIDESGVELGKVLSLQNFGAGDLLEVSTSGLGNVYIPFDKDKVVKEVDLNSKQITVAWDLKYNAL